MSKILVAYFSAGGVTAGLAKRLAEAAGADLHEIEPAEPYTEADLDWQNSRSRSTLEMQDKASRPAVRSHVEHMDDYSTVFVGFPIWWGIAPTIVNTFLEGYDFSGKTVIPFATSGGSGIGDTDRWLHGSCSAAAQWKPGKRLPASASVSELKNWIRKLDL